MTPYERMIARKEYAGKHKLHQQRHKYFIYIAKLHLFARITKFEKNIEYALVAQLVEQLALNETVVGSNPTGGTSKEFASDFGSPRFARRLICIQFWAQKRIGGFAKWFEPMFFRNVVISDLF